jgi:hypothetical protein
MSYLRKSFIIIAFLSASLSACSSTQDLHFAASGIGTNVYSDDSAEQYRMNKTYFGHLCAMAEIPHGTGPENGPYCLYNEFGVSDWNTMVQAGINDIDLRCDAYLSWLDNRKRSEAPLLKQLSDTATRTQAILRFAGSTNLAIDVVAQAFGYAADSVINYNSRLLFEIDTSTVQALVLGRQNEFREGLTRIAFNNKPAVEHALRSYLRICLPFNIETEVNNVITVYQRTGGEPAMPLISAESAGASVRASRVYTMAPLTARQPINVLPRRTAPVELPRSVRADALFLIKGYTDGDVDDAQDALCVEHGPVGPKTLTGVKIFEQFMRDLPEVKQDGRITDQVEFTILLAKESNEPSCDKSRFRNIYEHKRLRRPEKLGDFIAVLNSKVTTSAPVSETAQLNDPVLRAKIAEANRQFNIDVFNGQAADHVLPALTAKLQFQ